MHLSHSQAARRQQPRERLAQLLEPRLDRLRRRQVRRDAVALCATAVAPPIGVRSQCQEAAVDGRARRQFPHVDSDTPSTGRQRDLTDDQVEGARRAIGGDARGPALVHGGLHAVSVAEHHDPERAVRDAPEGCDVAAGIEPDALRRLRREEQRAAAAQWRAEEVRFLGHRDGRLRCSGTLVGQIEAELRRIRPESDPFSLSSWTRFSDQA